MKENHCLYHIPGCPAYMRRPKNAVYYNAGSTFNHELSKAIGALMLMKYGDIKFNEPIIKSLNELCIAINTTMKDFPRQKADFISECVPNKEANRRVDLVRLSDDTRFEFETNHKIKKEGDKTITILI